MSEKEFERENASYDIEIICADVDMVGYEILDWGEVGGLWEEHGLDEQYGVLQDLVYHCPAIAMDCEDVDGGPGSSGTIYTVFVSDENAAKRQLRERIEDLIELNQGCRVCHQGKPGTTQCKR
jgi:hypothetical protein